MIWLYKINWLSMHIAVVSQYENVHLARSAQESAKAEMPESERDTTTYGVIEATPEMIARLDMMNRQDGRPRRIES